MYVHGPLLPEARGGLDLLIAVPCVQLCSGDGGVVAAFGGRRRPLIALIEAGRKDGRPGPARPRGGILAVAVCGRKGSLSFSLGLISPHLAAFGSRACLGRNAHPERNGMERNGVPWMERMGWMGRASEREQV